MGNLKKKHYGNYQIPKCFFCGNGATQKNNDGLPVCKNDRDKSMMTNPVCPNCRGFMELKKSKYGMFFVCINCGPISLAKYKRSCLEPKGVKKYKMQSRKTEG